MRVRVWNRIVLIVALLSLVSCTRASLDENRSMFLAFLGISSGDPVRINGTAMSSGEVKNALVRALPVSSDGSCDRSGNTEPLASSTTDDKGQYKLEFSRQNQPICVVVTPNSTGTSTMRSLKTGSDVSWSGATLYLESIIREPESAKPNANDLTSANKISTTLPNANISPLTRIAARRVQSLAKTSDVSSATQRANQEVTLRFNLFSNSSGLNTAVPTGLPAPSFNSRANSNSTSSLTIDQSVPDISRFAMDTSDLTNPQTQQLLLVLGGLEQIAESTGSTTDVSAESLELLFESFSESMASGEFKSTSETGESIRIGTGENEKNLGENPLANLLTKAIQQYAYESGSKNLGLTVSEINKKLSFYDSSAPGMNPASGTYAGKQSIELNNIDTEQTIHYTSDGSSPTCGSTKYENPIELSTVGNHTLKAVGCKNGTATQVSSADYTIISKFIDEPVFSKAGGEYNNSLTVSLSHPTGANIYYTLDGSLPDCSGSNGKKYSSEISMNVSFKLAAIACNGGSIEQSQPVANRYVIINQPYGLSYQYSNVTYTKNGAIVPNYARVSGERVSYSITPNLPDGLIFSSDTGSITGTPSVASAATVYTVTATNSAGSATANIQLAVTESAPTQISYSDPAAVYTRGILIQPNTARVNGSGLSYSVSPSLPSGLVLNATTGTISGIPDTVTSAGNYTVTAENSGGSLTFTLSIAVTEGAPSSLSYASTPYVLTRDTAIASVFPDVSGTVASYSITPALPALLQLDKDTGRLYGIASELKEPTEYTITGSNSSGSTSFKLSIAVEDTPPRGLNYPSSPLKLTRGEVMQLIQPEVSGTVTSYSVSPSLPAGLVLDTTTGEISGTPQTASTPIDYTITASNRKGQTTFALSLMVEEKAPSALSYSSSSYIYTRGVSIQPFAPKVTGTVSTYSVSPSLPAGLILSSADGKISGTPESASASTNYTVTAKNAFGSTTFVFNLTVLDSPPKGLNYAGAPFVYTINEPIIKIKPAITGTPTSYSVTPSLPTGLVINSTTGELSGTPKAITAQTDYTITASNSIGSTTFTLTMTVNNSPPSALAYAKSTYLFATDTAIPELIPSVQSTVSSYTISPSLPSGMSINTKTGVISGAPLNTSAATLYTVTASNVSGSTTTTISITVDNAAPSSLAYGGGTFTFSKDQSLFPVVPVVDRPVDSFSITPALPTGLMLNTTTGEISGTAQVVSAATAYTVTATNSFGSTTATINISVTDSAPSSLAYGGPYTFAQNSSVPVIKPTLVGTASSYSITPALPAGLSLNSSTGEISGTPTTISSATYTVTAGNAAGSTTGTINLAVINSSTFSIDSPTVAENAGSVSFTVTLSAALSSEVSVAYSTSDGTAGAADYTQAAGLLTFAAGQTSKTIVVAINNETTFENDETFSMALSSPTGATIATSTGTATITNDDTAPTVSIANTSGTEGGMLSFTVSLSTISAKPASVIYTLSDSSALAGSDYTTTSETVSFAPGELSKTISISTIDDTIYEGNETFTVIIGSEANAVLGTASATGTISDNDPMPAASITGTTITEGGTANLTVTLSNPSSSAITVNYTTANGTAIAGSDYTTATNTLTFPIGSTSKTVNILTTQDSIDEDNENFTINLTGTSGATLATSSAIVSIVDNDTANITVSSDGSNDIVEGGGPDSYSIVLDTKPAADVTVSFVHGPQLTTLTSLTFTTANWSSPQSVTLFADNDSIAEGLHTETISHTFTSADPKYNGFTIPSQTVNITDNDTAGVTITQSGGTTTLAEGGATDTYTVVLNSQPTADVTVTIAPDSQSTVSPFPLTFTPANWNTAQTVTVTATDDSIAEGVHNSTITHGAVSTDTLYSGIGVASVTANITDNDTAGVTLSTTTVGATEGSSNGSYTIVLDSEPTADVTVSFNTGVQVTAISSVTFTSANWSTPQTITVAAVDDVSVEGAHNQSIVHAVASVDTNYNSIGVSNVTTNIVDNDTPGVTITDGGPLTIAEGGTTDAYSVVLNTQPTANVTVNISSDAESTTSVGSLTFTTANWNTVQWVTVIAVDDSVAEGAHNSTITHSSTSSDGGYNALGIASVTANISDNDTAGVTISSTTINATEGGGTGNYSVYLNTQPTSGVTINLSANSELSLSTSSLVFTTGNWNTPQNVTVTAVDDSIYENSHASTITHTASSTDTSYNGVGILSTTTNITDNETEPVVSVAGASVNEATGSVNFTATIPYPSTQAISVNYTIIDGTATTADSDYSSVSGTFTIAAGTTSDIISVSITDDAKFEADETIGISLDTPVNTTIGSTTPATITNDDTTPTLSVDNPSVAEGNGTITFTLTLSAVSGQDVVFNYVTADGTAVSTGDYTTTSGSMTITAGSTSTTVNVSIQDDTVVESDETFNLNLTGITNTSNTTASGTATILNDDLNILSAQTMDVDGNGQIDHYKLTFSSSVSDSSFPGYVLNSYGNAQTDWVVSSYSGVVFAHGSSAPEADTVDDNIIYIKFTESGIPDTGAKPDLTTTVTPGLTGFGGEILPQISTPFVESDTAMPVIVSATSTGTTAAVLTFSEAMDSVTAQNAGNYSFDNGLSASGASLASNVVTLTTSVQNNVLYTVTANGVNALAGSSDTSYNATFTGATPPAVTAQSPIENTSGIYANTDISITFNMAMDPASITTNTADTSCSGTFQVSNDSFSSCIQMSASPSTGDNITFTVTPATYLTYNSGYQVRVTTGAYASTGSAYPLPSTYTSTFNFQTEQRYLHANFGGGLDADTGTDADDGFVIRNETTNDAGNSIARGLDGSIYVTGWVTGTGHDMALWKFDQNGVYQWHQVRGEDAGGGDDNNDRGSHVLVNKEGNILVAGHGRNTASSFAAIVWKYKPDGTLDNSFDTDGISVQSINTSYHQVDAAVLAKDGGIYIAGSYAASVGDRDPFIMKFLPSGGLDLSFSGDGKLPITSTAGVNDYIHGLALDESGNIYATGIESGVMTTWKFLPDGSLDWEYTAPGGSSRGNAITTNTNGDVFVTGFRNNTNIDVAVWKITQTGTLDGTFGEKTFDNIAGPTSGNEEGKSIFIQDGKLVIGGYSEDGNSQEAYIIRLLANGSLDTTFHGDGKWVHHNPIGVSTNNEVISSIATGGFGNYLAAGFTSGTPSDLMVWKVLHTDEPTYNSKPAAGTLDTAFNTSGWSNKDEGVNEQVRRVHVDKDGYSYFIGTKDDAVDVDAVIWRTRSDGTTDPSFATDGTLNFGVAGKDEGFTDMVFDGQGNFYVTGYIGATSGDVDTYDLAVWKYSMNGILDTSFQGAGYRIFDLPGAGGQDVGAKIDIDAHGNLIVAAYGNDGNGYLVHYVVSFKQDGTLRGGPGGFGADGPDAGTDPDGFIIENVGGTVNCYTQDMLTGPKGNIYIAGYTDTNTATLTAFEPNGADKIWFTNGSTDSMKTFMGMALTQNGELAVAGNGSDTNGMKVKIYSLTGSLSGGTVGSKPGTGIAEGLSIVRDHLGSFYVTGKSNNGADDDMAVWKINSTASALDTGFNTTGYKLFNDTLVGGAGVDMGYSITLDAYGKLIIGGMGDGSDPDMMGWKLWW